LKEHFNLQSHRNPTDVGINVMGGVSTGYRVHGAELDTKKENANRERQLEVSE